MVKPALGALMRRGRMCLHLPLCFLFLPYSLVTGMVLISKCAYIQKNVKLATLCGSKVKTMENVLVGED